LPYEVRTIKGKLEMTAKPSYVYDPKSDCELARTAEREKKTKSQRAIALEDVKFEGISRILDVGCGTGVVGIDLLNLIPSAQSLIGLDLEPSILRVAKEKIPNEREGNFVAGNVYDLPFIRSSFDLVGCQYVLQHLSQPAKALSEMRRVSRPGGQVVIFEFDDRTGFSYPPAPDELQELFQAKIELIERKGGDRSIGRKLYHLLRLAGWTEIEVKIIPDIWQGAADRKNALESAYLSFAQLKPQLIAENLISEESFEAGLKQLYDHYQGEMFSVLFFFAAFARNRG
jgi:ubiquinone/menaquinone biosynthesis C-methylase UbiE